MTTAQTLQEAASKLATAQATETAAKNALTAAGLALDAALLAEASGGPSAQKARGARDDKAHLLEVAQAGLAAAEQEHRAAYSAHNVSLAAEAKAALEALEQHLETHQALPALEELVKQLADFEQTQEQIRQQWSAWRELVRREDPEFRPAMPRKHGISIGGDKYRLVEHYIDKSGRGVEGPELERH